MALVRCDFFSDVLELSTSMTVILPQRPLTRIGDATPGPAEPHALAPEPSAPEGVSPHDPAQVLYLLHGLSDDDTMWTRRTSLERYAEERGLAVVMPGVHRSFYADGVHGMRFWTFLSEELPAVVEQFFRLSTRREDTFVAGLSMGGYGALRWALRHPDRFAAAASFSGALDVDLLRQNGSRDDVVRRVFGDRPLVGTDDDVFHLLAAADPATLPALYVSCGTDDELLGHSERLVELARSRGVRIDASFGPGDHVWSYWDDQIRHLISDWL